MNKEELSELILASMTDEDWNLLEGRTSGIPVSQHNRQILLKLWDCDTEFDEEPIDEKKVDDARKLLADFLNRTWADQPQAHKYVINGSLAQAFIFEKPMHAWTAVRYHSRAIDGTVRYYCPAKEKDSLCDYCPAESGELIVPFLQEKQEATLSEFGELSASVQKVIFDTGFSDAGVVPVEKLVFCDDIRKICESNRCRSYGTTWACPPAVGTLEKCRSKVLGFQYLQLFSKVYKLLDSMDFEGMKEAMADFKDLVLNLDRSLRGSLDSMLILSNESCGRCAKCTYPDAPCRFPEELHPSIEGFGFNVSQIAAQAGMKYMNGSSNVTFFGAVLY